MNDNLHLELIHDEDRALDLGFLGNDNAYYDSIGEDRDGLGGARGFLITMAWVVLIIIMGIELLAFMAVIG